MTEQLFMVEKATGRIVGAVLASHPETFPCRPAYELKREDELTVAQLEAYEFWEERP